MRRTLVAGILIALGWILGRLFPSSIASDLFMILAAAIAGWPIANRAWQALRFRVLGIPALVTVAALGAIAIGEYWEAAVVTFLFAFGSYLEARTLAKTRGLCASCWSWPRRWPGLKKKMVRWKSPRLRWKLAL